jgi:GAF domain-containing protein
MMQGSIMDRQVVSDWKDEMQRRRAMLLNHLFLTAVLIGLLAMGSLYLSMDDTGLSPLGRLKDMLPFLSGWMVALVAWLWRGLGYRIRSGVLLLLAYSLGFYLLASGGLSGGGRLWMVLVPVLALVLLGPKSGFVAGGGAVLSYVLCAVIFSQNLFPQVFPRENPDMSSLRYWLFSEGGDFLIAVVGFILIVWSFSRGWLEALTGTSAANEQLRTRTEKLEQKTRQLQATAAVAHACSSILDPEALAVEVVERIQREFSHMGVYYVSLFLLHESDEDDEEQVAVLRAATGSVGQQLVEQGYILALDTASAIGQCVASQQPAIAPDAENDVALVENPLLEHTRAEVALPLISRGRVFGALSVQSTQHEAFGEDDVAVLRMMADQVAVAIDNAGLFTQTGAALREVQTAQRRYLTRAWREFLAATPVSRFDHVQPGTRVGDDRFLRDAWRAARAHERTVATNSSPAEADDGSAKAQAVLSVPLRLRGQVIGTVSLHETRRRREWTPDEIAMTEAVAEQVMQTVENLRLMGEAQRRVARERTIRDISDQMQRAMDMETLMRVTAEELNQALGGSRAYVRLGVEVPPSSADGDGHSEGD